MAGMNQRKKMKRKHCTNVIVKAVDLYSASTFSQTF